MAEIPLRFSDLVSAEMAARIKQLMLFSRHRVEGRFAGDNKSVRKGFSSDFLQHRQYFPGDNLKHLDWRVFGRTGRHVIREYEEMTDLDMYLVVDNSGSMGCRGGLAGHTAASLSPSARIGPSGRHSGWPRSQGVRPSSGEGQTKHEFTVKLAAVLIYLVNLQQDSFGLSLFAESVIAHCKPGTGRRQLQRVYELLLSHPPAGIADWQGALRQIQARIRRKGLAIIISDFMGDPEAVGRGLAGFRSTGCDVIAFHVTNPFEQELTQTNMTRFVDVEDRSALTVDPMLLRAAYRKQFTRHGESICHECAKRGISYARLSAGDDYEKALGEYLRKRMAMLL